jgi:hypothetical protein
MTVQEFALRAARGVIVSSPMLPEGQIPVPVDIKAIDAFTTIIEVLK